jgi:4-hydroxy-3-polyprenylbenzoate decarboxylase
MSYASLRACVDDLERHGRLVRIAEPLDPDLEIPYVHLRVHEAGGPALLFERPNGAAMPAVSNLFGTIERSRFILRDTYERIRTIVGLRADPTLALKKPWRHLGSAWHALFALPKRVRSGPVLHARVRVGELPQIRCWPKDGGPFVTLPQVYTEDPGSPGPMRSNVGMYRIQLAGNEYTADREIGLHYQIQRGIGVHHTAAKKLGVPLRVSIFVGGPPAHTVAAVMPLPEGLSELTFAGLLAGRRFRWTEVAAGPARTSHVVSADADVCICGTVDPDRTKPEGPFGDHLGYYSLAHEFPVLRVDAVYRRADAIWPFTVVGRPPQEDTAFGQLIHELTAPMVPKSIPGLRAMHAVDAAGVHPLMLAIGSERYVPWSERRPQELLTIANAILGFGQASLAKYLFVVAGEDDPTLAIHDVGAFLQHVLVRVDLSRDLHFQTKTTIDTLDYSGTGLNSGSKLVLAAAGPPLRTLGRELPERLPLPDGFSRAALALPGVVVIEGPLAAVEPGAVARLTKAWTEARVLATPDTAWPLVVVADDAEFTARSLANLLWVTFTRSNPSHDVEGVGASIEHKHWGCTGALVIDARSKPHHAPPLEADPRVVARVESLAAKGGPLHGLF